MALELAYTIHLGSDKNKKPSSKKMAQGNTSGTTSLSNNAIQNAAQLSRVNKHNLRKYENDTESIRILYGSNNLYKDVQELYIQEFEQARLEYNAKQTRKDREIKDYFKHISDSDQWDLACEFVVELGDKDFWQDKDVEYRKKMSDVYNEQVGDLMKVVPEFKVANAVVHYDETSPHMHIVGLPVRTGCKRGLSKQVAKSKIFTKESLAKIQDEMRKRCIKSYNKFYGTVTELKKKQKGRNEDFNVKDMPRYKELKREKEQKLTELESTNKKTETLNTKANEINKIVENLKSATFNKNNKIISVEDIEKIKDYTKEVKDITKSIKKVSNINNLVDNIEKNYNNVIEENSSLKIKLKNAESKITKLEKDISWKDKIISKLQVEKQKFEDLYYSFKGFWHSIIKRFQGMIGYYEDNNYKNVAKDLYEHEILNYKEYETILDIDKPIENIEESIKIIKNKNDKVK